MAVIPNERDRQELRRVVRKLDTIRGPGVVNAPDQITINPARPEEPPEPPPIQPIPLTAQITEVQNSYLIAQAYRADGTLTGVDIYVDKGEGLYHENIAGATTTGPNALSVTVGEEVEQWVVDPDLPVGKRINIMPIGYSPVTYELNGETLTCRYGLTSMHWWFDTTNNLAAGA